MQAGTEQKEGDEKSLTKTDSEAKQSPQKVRKGIISDASVLPPSEDPAEIIKQVITLLPPDLPVEANTNPPGIG